MIELILFGTFFVLLLLGVPVAFALGLAAVFALLSTGGFADLSVVPSVFTASIASETLLAIPFFILAGVIMEYAGISRRLVDFANACVGHRKHGLAIVVIVAAFFFSAISGSGPATVAAIGTILIPALIRQGYTKRHSASMVASAGSMGIIIPPSIAFIVFAVVVSDFAGVSIARLFVAGVVPGILLAIALLIACFFLPRAAPVRQRVGALVGGGGGQESAEDGAEQLGTRASWGAVGTAFTKALPGLLVPVLILGGIYGGIVTPTESAVVAAGYALLVGLFVYRELRPSSLFRVFVTAAGQSAVIMLIVGAASVFAYVVTANRIADKLADWLLGITTNRLLILLLAVVLLLIIGAFIDAVSALYLFVPIVAPVLLEVGVDVTTIGVMMTVGLALGLITPPVGVNLFVAAGIAKTSLTDAVKGIAPFFTAGLVVLLLVTYVPGISNWLPDLFGF
ncbi:C4-dicarboxylate transporter DctM subunit [Tamaricihabitans halophyticus]|uniref:C4-dicarboxylate transporter DctM subunit n=1 Tax=Tamaricihabitans halophyticus TaxID=1262583 RepID=A0A4R2R249_9PSEU|nr:TRAP transporter large permease [Tamaricihabitans halophyticus]TCP53551.1 C4-dicarboxylate transporter DctM subunit [Tamaricihabitans halophyticus]